MPAKKGHPKYGGRPKGGANKVTRDVKEAYKTLLDNNLDKMQGWLNDTAAAEGPSKALGFMLKLSEYILPKLARTELSGPADDDGKPTKITVEIVSKPLQE